MYILDVPDEVMSEIIAHSSQSPSIPKKLAQLENNPLADAIETEILGIGKYYVNAGRWCILFDIDDTQQTVYIFKLLLSARLHKIITGRIHPSNLRQ